MFNQALHICTSLIAQIESQGILSWSPSTAYITGGLCIGSDMVIYQALQNSTNKDPVSEATYWKIYLSAASTSVSGVVQLSNSYNGTSQTKATTEKALTDGLATVVQSVTGSAPITSSGGVNPQIGINAATDSAKGAVELATGAETITGTDTERAITPAALTSKLDTDGTLAGNSDTRIASQKATKTYVDANKVIQQIVNVQTSDASSGSWVIPLDNTIPQNTEGQEVMTLAITPKSATNKLMIEFDCMLACIDAANYCIAALFKNNDADALIAGSNDSDTTITGGITVNKKYYMTAGTTNAITFKVRVGSPSGTVAFNGAFGAAGISSMTITEIKA